MTLVKVCGIVSEADAEAAIGAGADAIGLNFVSGRARCIDLPLARKIAGLAAGRVVRVGVFADEDPERIREFVEAVPLDVVQLHGDESPEDAASFPFPIVKAIAGGPGLEERAARYPGVDLLVDHPGGDGGRGETWDWAGARALVSRGRRVWLAGGLDPDNVAGAIRAALPLGVDVASGVETAARDGRKDPARLSAFADAARAARKAGVRPDASGYFDPGAPRRAYGGRLVPETLMPAVQQLAMTWDALREDPTFWDELREERRSYIGRPTPLYFAERLSADIGARIYLKREDLAHTGAHKINNAIGQALIARRMGKRRIIAETGAGQHGVATATACARYGLDCEVYMGEEDTRRQQINVFRMELLGAQVHPVTSGSRTLKDAMNEALRDWATNVADTYYLIGSTAGPHPYPALVRDLQAVIGEETREQILAVESRLPDLLVACIGGGSNALGLFAPFYGDAGVRFLGVEAGGEGIEAGRHGAPLCAGSPGALHGSVSYVLQDDAGQIFEAHSISAGLDYPGVGPEHSFYKDTGRAEYTPATDAEALDAFVYLSRLEGIIPAFESAHAIAELRRRKGRFAPDTLIVVNLSGRGDKDVAQARDLLARADTGPETDR